MGVIGFLLGGLMALAGFLLMSAIVIKLPGSELLTGSLWSTVAWGIAGLVLLLIGIRLMRS